jgi:hypothetical protein
MRRVLIIVLLLSFVMSVQIFAQQLDLPEPVLMESSFVYIPAAVAINLPDFADAAYLWGFNPGDGSAEIDFTSVASFAAAASSDAGGEIIPSRIRNNEYFRESVRLKTLAETSYESGDYDSSRTYAAESLRYAQLSDEYVALQLKIKEADDTILLAKQGMDSAASKGLDRVYPSEWAQGQELYTEATAARTAEDWDGAISSAQRILAMLAGGQDVLPLPAQYTVRTWRGEQDCLWNIAGYPWVYGDSNKWRLLYDANKSKMPEADNPNWIEPGMILDIPSINDEVRYGVWQLGLSYPDL